VGLLSGALSLAREPVRLTLRVWEAGLSSAASAARIGLELLDPERSSTTEHYPPPPAAPVRGNGAAPGAPTVDAASRAPADSPPPPADSPPPPADSPPPPADSPPPPADPDELIPDHVDEEVVLVAEVAEQGAEGGAGPELHIAPPWEGYDRMAAVEVCDRLSAATAELAAAVELYESARKSRRSVLAAAERALRA
jgi:hypothetical protein